MIKKLFDNGKLLRIISEGSYELGLHDGRCEVAEKLVEVADACEKVDEPWKLTTKEAKMWVEEEFNISVK